MKSDKEKTIFELPIYSMPEAEFNRRWNKFKEDCTRNLRDEDKKQKLEAFHQIYFPELQIAIQNGHLCHVRRSVCDIIGGQPKTN